MPDNYEHRCTLECFTDHGFTMALGMAVHACAYVGACPSCGDPVDRSTDHQSVYAPCGGVLLCQGCQVLEEDGADPGEWDYAHSQSVPDILTDSRPQTIRDRTLDALALVEATHGDRPYTAVEHWQTLEAEERDAVALVLAAWVGMMNEMSPVPFSDWCDSVRDAALRRS